MASTRKYDINKINSNNFVRIYKKEKPELNKLNTLKNSELEDFSRKLINSIQLALEKSAPKFEINRAESRIQYSSINRVPKNLRDLSILSKNLLQENRRNFNKTRNHYQAQARPNFEQQRFFKDLLDYYVGDQIKTNTLNDKKVKKSDAQINLDNFDQVLERLIANLSDGLPGLDFINASIWKFIFEFDKEYLIKFFKTLISSLYFPSVFKEGKLIVFRKPNRQGYEAENYRFITILSSVCKLYEKLIINRLRSDSKLQKYLDKVTNQYGYTRGKSRFSAINVVIDEMISIQKTNQYGFLIQLDIKRAFDLIKWDHILKIVESNFDNTKFILISELLKNRKIKINDYERPIHRGLPQGSSASHLLWLIGISDLLLNLLSISNLKSVSFVDDLTLIIKGNNKEQIFNKLAEINNVINSWLESSGLELNGSKCFYMQFNGKYALDLNKIKFGNVRLRSTNEIRYLGVFLNANLNFHSQFRLMESKIKDAIKALQTLFLYGKFNLTYENKQEIYTNVILKILTDCWSSWFQNIIGQKFFINKLRNLQKRALVVLFNESDYFRNNELCKKHKILDINVELQYKLTIKLAGDKRKRRLTKAECDLIKLKVMQENNFHFYN